MQTNEVDPVPPLGQPAVQRPIEQTTNKPIEHMQTNVPSQPSTTQLAKTQNQLEVVNQPRATYNRPIGYEENSYLCNLCETPTNFSDKYKLYKHRARFHLAFDQKTRGKKRGNDEDNKISPKKTGGMEPRYLKEVVFVVFINLTNINRLLKVIIDSLRIILSCLSDLAAETDSRGEELSLIHI